MAVVPASLVKELRERTGAGMMDCKRALEETGGDLDAALKLLREKGIAQAEKRAGRETTEGKVIVRLSGGVGAMVAVGCETEPVSKNDEFLAFAERVADAVEQDGETAVEGLDGKRTELVAKLGENVAVQGAVRFTAADGAVLSGYVHRPAEKIGVLVHARGDAEAARLLAMHISFAAPRFATRSEVPETEVEAEREILSKQPDVVSKPEDVRARVVEGRLQKWFAEMVLEDQAWIHETAKTVGRALEEAGLEVIEFRRLSLAE